MNNIRCLLTAAGIAGALTLAGTPVLAQDAVSKGLTGDRAVPALDCTKAAKNTKACMDPPRAKKAKAMKKSPKPNDVADPGKAGDAKP